MQINELLTILVSFFTGGGLLILLTISIQKKKIRAEYDNLLMEAKGNELNNVEKAIKIWRDSAEAMRKQSEEISAQREAMRQQNFELQQRIRGLEAKVAELVKELKKKTNEEFRR